HLLLRLLALHSQEQVEGVARADAERARERQPASEFAMQLDSWLTVHHNVVALANVETGGEIDRVAVGDTVTTRARSRPGPEQTRYDDPRGRAATSHHKLTVAR